MCPRLPVAPAVWLQDLRSGSFASRRRPPAPTTSTFTGPTQAYAQWRPNITRSFQIYDGWFSRIRGIESGVSLEGLPVSQTFRPTTAEST